jgi:hypothetical protein
MSSGAWVTIAIALFCVADTAVVVWVVARVGWMPIQQRYPVRRALQSFKVGILNFGFSVHVTVDETCLHLEPARFLRWVGASTISIPWSEITITNRSRSGRWITVKADKWTIQGPAWCLELAEPEAGSEKVESRK